MSIQDRTAGPSSFNILPLRSQSLFFGTCFFLAFWLSLLSENRQGSTYNKGLYVVIYVVCILTAGYQGGLEP